MSIEGRIAVDINFTDSATVGGASSVKKIQLVSNESHNSGKVAIVTGTCSTSTDATHVFTSIGYTGADGVNVTMTRPEVLGVMVTPAGYVSLSSATSIAITRSRAYVSLMDVSEFGTAVNLVVRCTAGTASYTLFLHGT